MKIRLVFLLCISIIVFGGECWADSLWSPSQGPIYGVSKRRIKVGDVITVYVSESTNAAQSASTMTRKDSSIGGKLLANWDQISNVLGNQQTRRTLDLGIDGNDAYEGTGQTVRRSNVKAVVSSIVTEILKSGNLYIVGEHKVKVNNEIETVKVSGIIRPQDISVQNSVFSYQIAKAEVSVHGEGVVASKQTPGIMSKMFNWLF
jgi:flagellar L-ring protein precursor FlgH